MSDRAHLDVIKRQLNSFEREIVTRLKSVKDRNRAEDVRLLHEVRSLMDPMNGFASQAGQDRVIDQLFNGMSGGTFVDVGGYDGVTGSNTFYFERNRKWSGLLLEPVEAFRVQAETARECPCLPIAVSDKEGEARFMAVSRGYTQMSGLIDNYDPNLLTRVRSDNRHVEEEITVTTQTLPRILEDNGMTSADFISLDIEGGELPVLESFPFADFQVGAWAIENNTGTSEIGKIMRAHDYQLVEFCGPDEIYAHRSLL